MFYFDLSEMVRLVQRVYSGEMSDSALLETQGLSYCLSNSPRTWLLLASRERLSCWEQRPLPSDLCPLFASSLAGSQQEVLLLRHRQGTLPRCLALAGQGVAVEVVLEQTPQLMMRSGAEGWPGWSRLLKKVVP